VEDISPNAARVSFGVYWTNHQLLRARGSSVKNRMRTMILAIPSCACRQFIGLVRYKIAGT